MAFFEDGGGGVFASRFMASSKLIPCNLKSMAFGMVRFDFTCPEFTTFHTKLKVKTKPCTIALDKFAVDAGLFQALNQSPATGLIMNAQFINWKVTAILCTLILSGTALFIYEDFKADQLRQRQQAEAQQKARQSVNGQKPWEDFQPETSKPKTNVFDIFDEAAKNPPTRERVLTDAEIGIAPAAPVFSPVRPPQYVTPMPPDPILNEMRRANDIADDKLLFEKLHTPSSLDRYMDSQQLSDLIWLQSRQAADLHRIREIYEQQHPVP